jgi:two-component system response regulator MprA
VCGLTAQCSFDAVVLGPLGPGTESLTVCDALRRQASVLPIVLLVSRDGVEARVEGLDAGADDCLPVGCQVDELLARLRALLRRIAAVEPS